MASERRDGAARGAGLGVLVPGYPQWRWRQVERAGVLFGLFAAALGVGLFAWGTRAGAAMLLVAYGAHVASLADAIRQAAFPGFARGVPMVSASVGLGAVCYGPAAALGLALAWPGPRMDAPGEAVLVNRWAYSAAEPRPGDWVYFDAPVGRGFALARLVARPRASVEWSPPGLRVDGVSLPWTPPAAAGPPRDLALTVPDDYYLVAPVGPAARGANSAGLMLLPRRRLVGRAWARYYPIWSRRLLL